MDIRRKIILNNQTIAVSFSDDVISRSSGYRLEGHLSTEFEEFRALQLNGIGRWACNPTFIENETDVTLIGDDEEEPIRLQVESYFENYSKEITFPCLSILKAARVLASDNPGKIPPQINRLYNREDEAKRLEVFLKEVAEVIAYDSYIDIVEQLAAISPKFRHHLRQNAEKQLIRMLTGRWENDEYSIESYQDLNSRIQDFENIEAIQRLSKRIDTKQIIKQALKKTEHSGSIDDLVVLARVLELFDHQADILRQYQVDAILATQIIDDDLNGAWNLIINCLSSEDSTNNQDFQSMKEQALSIEDYERKRELWKESLPLAVGNEGLYISIANYLYWTGRTKEYDGRLPALLYEAATVGFAQIEVPHMQQAAEFNLHFQKGINHRNLKNHEEAANSFLSAYNVGSDSKNRFDQTLPTRIIARQNWAISLSNHHRFNGEYECGINILQSTINELEKPKNASQFDNVENIIAELRAQTRILEMEQYLVDSDYELGLETAGNIIKQYAKAGNEDGQQWAITKRKEIQAIIHETNGSMEEAASLHRSIGESDSISEARQNWHIHRADICEAKQLALDRQFQEAKDQLLQIQDRTDQLKSEANDFAVVLEAIIDYQNGVQRHFRDSLTQLSSESTHEPRIPPMRLEYNYEDPLAVIHAAQWLRTYDVDSEVLSMSVDVALQGSLIPLQDSANAAEIVGLDDVNLRDQWLMQLPAPIAHKITQIRLDVSVPQTDYSGLGSRLFSLLELYLAIFGEYYGSLKWGNEWRKNLSEQDKTSDMALGDLTNVFTKCDGLLQYGNTIADLINGTGSSPSVVKLRNDIGHAKTDEVYSDEYNSFQDRVFSIFQESAEEIPIIGEMIETRGKGEFQVKLVQLKWWRPQRRIFIQTDSQLEEGTLYYFPQSPIRETAENSKITINSDEIVQVQTDRILSKFS